MGEGLAWAGRRAVMRFKVRCAQALAVLGACVYNTALSEVNSEGLTHHPLARTQPPGHPYLQRMLGMHVGYMKLGKEKAVCVKFAVSILRRKRLRQRLT